MKTKRTFFTLLLLFICSFSAYFGIRIFTFFYALDAPSFTEGQKNAATLMAALEQYQQQHAQYPSELYWLAVQKYLVPIPQPNSKYSYVYFGFRDHYMLGFKHKGSTDDWYCYNSLEKKWELYDSTCFGN